MNTCLKEVVYTTVPSRLNKGEEEGKEDMGRKQGGERNNGKYGLKVLGVLVLRQLILDSAVGWVWDEGRV